MISVIGVIEQNRKHIQIQQPQIQSPEDESLWREVLKYAKLVPLEPDPNFGRVQEIKEEIKKGKYLTRDKIEETVARVAIRFMSKEQ